MIGIFDSGSGGLSVLQAIRKRLPSADILYFGDIKNAPYGEKPQEILSELTAHAMEFLRERGAKNIVSACNSVSASLAISLFDSLNLSSNQIIEMVGPTVNHFREQDTDARVLLCATPATIDSGRYQNAFHMIEKKLITIAIPKLAGAIEFGASEDEIEHIITIALSGTPPESFGTILLGCTHYPLVIPIFRRILGNAIRIFDPAEAVASRVEKQSWSQEDGTGKLTFVITKDSPQFRTRVVAMFPESAQSVEVIP